MLLLKDGDIISIDIPNKKLDVELSKEEIDKRFVQLKPFKPKITKGYLGRYAKMVTSANTGAIFKNLIKNKNRMQHGSK